MTPERKIITGIVKENSRIAAGIYEMVIEAEAFKNFIPGQFINVYLADKSMLLPRPISISEADDSSITLVYKVVGKGTGCLSGSRAGESIKISSPLGNGFDIKDDHTGKKIALVAGGIGIPPMIGLAGALKKRGTHVYAFLGFPSEVFLFEKLKAICDDVLIATDDGSAGFNGNAVELLEKSGALFDKYFACGPKAMLKSLCEYIAKVERDVQVSVEERMGCGYGACVGCSCKIREEGAVKRKSVCKDGPVFWGKDVVWGE